MIITAWRIYKPKHAATAFSGEGARLYGGRFNSKGVAVVYTSQSESLASLEMLVHLQSTQILNTYVVRPVTFDDAIIRRVVLTDLPTDWRKSPPRLHVQKIGDRWVAAAESAVLQIPSAIIQSEFNFLLNPSHPDFAKVRLGIERPYKFDRRLLKIR